MLKFSIVYCLSELKCFLRMGSEFIKPQYKVKLH
jgi:hypothetical protein